MFKADGTLQLGDFGLSTMHFATAENLQTLTHYGFPAEIACESNHYQNPSIFILNPPILAPKEKCRCGLH